MILNLKMMKFDSLWFRYLLNIKCNLKEGFKFKNLSNIWICGLPATLKAILLNSHRENLKWESELTMKRAVKPIISVPT